MARKPTTHIIPSSEIMEDFKKATSKPFPQQVLMLELIIEALLHRFDPEESQYLRNAIKALAVLENGRLPKDGLAYHTGVYTVVHMLLSGKPQGNHNVFAFHAQKTLLINRLKTFEGKEIKSTLEQEDKRIIEELTVCPCYCRYATSLHTIWTRPQESPHDPKPKAPCEIYKGVDLIHRILGILHNLAPTTVQDLLKNDPTNNDSIDSIDGSRVERFLKSIGMESFTFKHFIISFLKSKPGQTV